MDIFFHLHVDLFAGEFGKYFLGAMGILLLVATVSGCLLYPAFAKNHEFGTIRRGHICRKTGLDLHNALGMLTLVWVLLVAGTSVLHTVATPIWQHWRYAQLKVLTSSEAEAVFKQTPSQAYLLAQQVAPEGTLAFIAFPNTSFASTHHYGFYFRGRNVLSRFVLQPVWVDVLANRPTVMPHLPFYVKGLLLAQPLHFGDYGGLWLKVLWAVWDGLFIVILLIGAYLWMMRHRSSRRRFSNGIAS